MHESALKNNDEMQIEGRQKYADSWWYYSEHVEENVGYEPGYISNKQQ